MNKQTREKAMDISRPYTPRSERPRSTYGSLQMQISARGKCTKPKCLLNAGHRKECYP
jgi:hypothetical protein